LGQGHFSICRRGTNLKTNETVAIKVYKTKKPSRQREIMTKFTRQISVLQDSIESQVSVLQKALQQSEELTAQIAKLSSEITELSDAVAAIDQAQAPPHVADSEIPKQPESVPKVKEDSWQPPQPVKSADAKKEDGKQKVVIHFRQPSTNELKPVTFESRPLGFSYKKQVPLILTETDGKSKTGQERVQVGAKVVQVGNTEIVNGMDYDDVSRILREELNCLPRLEDDSKNEVRE